MTPRPTLLLYGPCQIVRIGLILRELSSVCEAYEVYVFDDRATASGPAPLPPENVIRWCERIIYQVRPFGFLPAFAEDLVARGRGIRAPFVSCDAFWPSEVPCNHDPRYPELPNGRYPLGDYILARLLRDNPNDEAVVNEYLEMDFGELFPLENRIQKWFRLLEKLENETSIKISDFISDNWRTKRLFWDSRHAANNLLGQIVRKLLECIGTPAVESELESALQAHEEDFMMKPIHPSLVRSLQLAWISHDDLYKHLDDPPVTSREWYLRYVAHTRKLLEILPEPFQDETTSMRFWRKVTEPPAWAR
jgi:Polysaccharide biosynthesis enzyme WcbI